MNRLLVAIISLCCISYTAFSKLPDPDKMVEPSSEYLIGTLDNGIKYYIKENKRPENRAEIQMVIKAGSVQEDPSQYGLAHFTEHMAFNGTKNFPGNELIQYLESTGMSFGGDINANTSFERVYYLLQIPTDNQKMLEDGFQVLRDWMTDITFAKDSIDKERKIILEEWRLRAKEANSEAQLQMFKTMYKGSKFEQFPIGDTSIILNAPKKEFLRYYNDYYRPDISAIIAVGDFDKNEILKQIKNKFQSVKKVSKPTQIDEIKIAEHSDIRVSRYENKELSGYSALLMHRHYDRPKGTYGSYRMDLKDILVSTMLSLRFQELTIKGTKAFQVAQGAINDFPGEISTFLGFVQLKADKQEQGYREMIEELYRMDQHGFVASEFERAKASIISQYESMVKNKENLPSNQFASQFFSNFMDNEAIPGIEEDFNIIKTYLEEITLDEVNKTAKNMLTDNSVVIHHTGPENLMSKDKLLSIYKEVKGSKLEPWIDAASKAALMDLEPKPGSINDVKKQNFSFKKESGSDKEEFEVSTYTLSNGVKVKLMHTDLNEDQVVLGARSPGGNLKSDMKTYYSANQADNFAGISGVGENDLTTIQKILSDKKVSVSPYINDYYEGFSGQASPDDLKEMFQMIYLYFTYPRMDKGAIEASLGRLRENVKNSQNDPSSIFSDSVTNVLYNYHPRQFSWTNELVDKVNPILAHNWFRDRFADASDFTFYFVGKFDDAVMNQMIITYLASLPTKDRNEKWEDRGISTVDGPLKKVIKVGTEPKAEVRLRIDGDYPEYSQMDNMKMSALARALGILLTEQLREEKQIVYSSGARAQQSYIPEKTFTVQVNYQCDPERVEEGIEVVKEQMEFLMQNTLSEDYMSRIKEVIASQYKKAFENNFYWLNYLQSADWNGMEVDRAQTTLNIIENISAKDIKDYANKYFKIGEMKQFIRLPENM